MISALILPLFLAGTQANIPGAPSGDPAIRLWINNDGRFLPGDHAEVQVRTRDDGYLLVLHADPDGQLRVLFPLEPGDDNFVRGGDRYETFDIDGSWGRGMVYAAVSRDRFRFDGYRLGDQWDYRALAPSQLPREPESELTDLVRRVASGHFDYDVVTYDVIERVVYASDYWSTFFFDPFFRRPFFPQPVLVDRLFHWPFFFGPRRLAPAPFRDRRHDFRPAVNTAQLTRWRARVAVAASGGRRVELRSEGSDRLAVADARQRAIQARRDDWPVDVSPRRREPVTEARRDNWPVHVSPRRRGLVTETRRDNWPVDVSPRRRDPGLPTARRAVDARPTDVRGGPGLRPSHQPQGHAPGPRLAPHRPVGLPHR